VLPALACAHARHVDSTNPGRSNLEGLFRSKPIPEAKVSNRLIKKPGRR